MKTWKDLGMAAENPRPWPVVGASSIGGFFHAASSLSPARALFDGTARSTANGAGAVGPAGRELRGGV